MNDTPKYYLGNELVRFENCIHASSKKYVNEILRKCQKTHGDLKNEVPPMRVKEHPEFYYSPLLNEKYHKDFQHIIGLCQWTIESGRFDLVYAVSSLSRFFAAPRVGNLDMASRIFA